jgi:putative ABC transport system permease protein
VSFDPDKVPIKGGVLVMDLAFASPLIFSDAPGNASYLAVRLQPGANREQAEQDIQEWLGQRAQVHAIDSGRRMVADVTAGLDLGFAIGGAGALVIGLFLVYNALSVSVAERRHDIGILRSVGATRAQIGRLFVGEAGTLGLSGALVGVPLGYALAWLAIKPLSRLVNETLVPVDSARVEVSARLVLVALLCGVAVAVLAALVPALQAAGEEPAEAVRRVPRRHGVLFLVLQIGAALLLIGLGLAAGALRQQLPLRLGMFTCIVCLLLGGLVATPLLATALGRVVQPFFRLFLGLEGRLAADNLVRAPGRTGLVIAALAATGGLLVMTAGFLRSASLAINTWLRDDIAADLYVSSGGSLIASETLAMTDVLRDKLASLKEVAAVVPFRYHSVECSGHSVLLLATDTRAFEGSAGAADRPLARLLARYPRLHERGTTLVSENFALLNRVKVGERIHVRGPHGAVELEVLGTVVDYSWKWGTLLVDRSWFAKVFADTKIDLFDLFLQPGADVAGVRQEILKRWGEEDALFVLTRDEALNEADVLLRRVYGAAYAQQMVIGLVALLGVASALFISVLQRRRELGLLRAVGASRWQVLRSVLAEAVLMGIIGAVVGFGIGVVLEWYVLDVMVLDEAGFVFPLRVPWLEGGLVSLLAVVLATLAGLMPAYRATRLRITEAIAYE